MTTPKAHSIQTKLLNYSHAHQENHNHTLSRYAIERLMYRLSMSPHADRFVLKGAMLFVLWLNEVHRPTKDLDLLGQGNANDVAPAHDLRRTPTSAVRSWYETVAKRQPEGNRQVPDAQTNNAHETGAFALNNFVLVACRLVRPIKNKKLNTDLNPMWSAQVILALSLSCSR